eukprot:TRINITY_DN17185_c0_g1_i1.p1 TRINITY_DN17185_c0_g1~~TRINITY_DN17185_c0_g1_i1.p1  ORF type:complete len:1470 (+),score=284.36 TRINITY_DN17185_c0_g1_i1:55-4410(+)
MPTHYKCVAATLHRIRCEPSYSSTLVRYINPGESVEVSEVKEVAGNKWARVQREGWSVISDQLNSLVFLKEDKKPRGTVAVLTDFCKTFQSNSTPVQEDTMKEMLQTAAKIAASLTPTSIAQCESITRFFSTVPVQPAQTSILISLLSATSYSEAPRQIATCISSIFRNIATKEDLDDLLEVLTPKILKSDAVKKASFAWFLIGVAGAAFIPDPGMPAREYFSVHYDGMYTTFAVEILMRVAVDAEARTLVKIVSELLSLLTTPSQAIADLILTQFVCALLAMKTGLSAELLGKIAQFTKLQSAHLKTLGNDSPPPVDTQNAYSYPTRMMTPEETRKTVSLNGDLNTQNKRQLANTARALCLDTTTTTTVDDLRALIEKHLGGDEPDIDRLNKPELVNIANNMGLRFNKNTKKDELKALILSCRDMPPGDEDNPIEGLEDHAVNNTYEMVLPGCHGIDRNSMVTSWVRNLETRYENEGLASAFSGYCKRHRVTWLNERLVRTTEGDVEEDSTTDCKDFFLRILFSKTHSVVAYYTNITRHLVALFTSVATPAATKKRVSTSLCSLLDVDPSLIEFLWPAIASGLKDGNGNTGKETLLDVLAVVLNRLDRFDVYMEAAESQEANPPGTVESMHKKMLNMMLHVVATTTTIGIAKKACRSIGTIAASSSAMLHMHQRLLSQVRHIHYKAAENVKDEISHLILSLLCAKKSPGANFATLVTTELSETPLLDFPIGHSYAPSEFLQDFKKIFGVSKNHNEAKEIIRTLQTQTEHPKSVVLCCLHLLARIVPNKLFEKEEGLLADVTTTVKSFLATPDKPDESIAVFIHGCHLLVLLGYANTADGVATALADVVSNYSIKHSQRVLSMATSCLASISTRGDGKKPVPGNIEILFTGFLRTYKSVRYLYLEALRQRGKEMHPQILPHVMRGMYLLSLFVVNVNWTKRAIVDHVAQVKLDGKNELCQGKGILNNVYGVLSDLARIPMEDDIRGKVMIMQLKLLSALCTRCASIYFTASQNLIKTSLSKERPELRAAGLGLIKDFLTEEEQRVETAGKIRAGSQISSAQSSQSSPGGRQEDSGMGSSLMQQYLATILDCLMSEDSKVRNISMEVVKICYHQGLSVPLLAIENLICTSADPTQPGLARSSLDLLKSFCPKFASTIVSKAAGGVLSSYIFHTTTLGLPAKSVKGHFHMESIHQQTFGLTEKVPKGMATYALQVLRLIGVDEKVEALQGKIPTQYEVLHFPRFVVEVLALLRYKKESQVHGVIDAAVQSASLNVEEVKGRLQERLQNKKAMPDKRNDFELVLKGLCVMALNELAKFLKTDYGLSKRKKKDDTAKSRLREVAGPPLPHFITFCDNVDVIEAVCTPPSALDAPVAISHSNLNDLLDTLDSMDLAEQCCGEEPDAKKMKKPAKKPGPKRGKKKRQATEDSSDSDSSSSSSSDSSSAPKKRRRVRR